MKLFKPCITCQSVATVDGGHMSKRGDYVDGGHMSKRGDYLITHAQEIADIHITGFMKILYIV
jgi:hypothetical protein